METGKHEFKGTLTVGGPFIEGIKIGQDIAEEKFRTEAFAAIRRAVEVMRAAEKTYDKWDGWDDPYVSIPAFRIGIRHAIRAAIGSPKANV